MKSIFYDLETSSLSPVGQILNLAFVVCDNDFEVVDKFLANIEISRLELPHPKALEVNGTDPLTHNETADGNEAEVMRSLRLFLGNHVEDGETRLIGYNSAKFDLEYLRTSMIRNGVYPYFQKNVKYRDLLHIVEYLRLNKKINTENRKLETLYREFFDDKDEQLHESYDDVLMTIRLAKKFYTDYGADIREFDSYDPEGNIESNIVDAIDIYDSYNVHTFGLIDENERQALWMDLDKYAEGYGDKSIFYFNKVSKQFYPVGCNKTKTYKDLYDKAKKEFSHVKLDGFFGPKDCDIEAYIYDVPLDGYEVLDDAARGNFKRAVNSKLPHVRELAMRMFLKYYSGDVTSNDKLFDKFRGYSLYRYGGKMKIGRMAEQFHPTLEDLVEEISQENVEQFYKQSEIYKHFGKELL